MQRFLPVVLEQILPKSRTRFPKQFIDILNTGKTLIQQPMNGTRHLYQKKIFTL